MAKNLTIWTLNRAADLLEIRQEEIIEKFKPDYVATFGNRTGYNHPKRPIGGEKDINLMPGVEYFVPIVPKCIGKLFDDTHNRKLQEIKEFYTEQAGQKEYSYFWETDEYDLKMHTHHYKGYYSILRETRPNFLIGYSEGGLVARYLFWLAETVFEEPDVVKGVITLSAPNFGSPLANPQNAEAIMKGFAEILAILLGIPDPLQELAEKAASRLSVERFLGVFERFMEAFSELDLPDTLDFEKLQKAGLLRNILQDLYNWLGGLRDDPNNAFYDLSIFRLMENDSVLASVFESNPANRVHGIISGNNDLKEILIDLWDLIIDIIFEKLREILYAADDKFADIINLDFLDIDELKTLDVEKRLSKIEKIKALIDIWKNS